MRPFIIHSGVLGAALCAGIMGCDTREERGETTIEEVRDWPNAYLGKNITAVGEVAEEYASGVFRMDGKGTWWNDDILVVVPREQRAALENGTEVRVTGEVALLTVAEIEREYGLDLEPELEVEFKSKPILMARNLTVVDSERGQ